MARFIITNFNLLYKSKEFGIFIALIILCIILSISTPYFLTVYNVFTVMRQISIIAIISIGMTMVILTEGIDLSVGSIFGLTNVIVAIAIVHNFGIAGGIIAALLCGVVIGFGNGVIISKLELPPFIVTLGMMSIARGLALVITKGWPVTGLPPSFDFIGNGYIWIIPFPVVIMVIIAVVGHIFLTRTIWGTYIYAIGGNEEAAKLCGINVNFIKILVYSITGFVCAISGIIMTSRLSQGEPSAGLGYELDAIAAAVIGGTSLSGGEGSIIGTLIGASIMGVIRNGLVLLGVSAFWQTVIIGIVIILAVAIEKIRKKLSAA
jgi:ribose transport system permease protein